MAVFSATCGGTADCKHLALAFPFPADLVPGFRGTNQALGLVLPKLPDDLSHHAQEEFGVVGFESEAQDQLASLLLKHGGGTWFDVATHAQGVEQSFRNLLDRGCGRRFDLLC